MTTPELEELLAEDAPRPSDAFTARMEERLAQGFPRRRRARMPAVPRVPSLPRPALAGLASAALALSVTVALLVGGGENADDARTAVAPAAPGARDAAGSAESLEPAPREGIAPGESERDIERSARLTLAAPADELGRAAEAIVGVADRHDGFVLRSEVNTGEDGGGGSFELRIPQERLRAALVDLSAIGEVRARSEQGQDVTSAVSSTEERLDEARSDRRGLLRRLERAESDEASRAIRRRLRLVSAEIRGLSGELRALRERVDYAAVSVTLEEGGSDGDGGSDGSDDGAGAALDDALGTLEGALEMGIRALGVLLPLSLLAAAGWLATRLALRRRRNAALG
ncbi:MAG: DUF4349 domain-containing protein [Thermoleophilaceae bacterium]